MFLNQPKLWAPSGHLSTTPVRLSSKTELLLSLAPQKPHPVLLAGQQKFPFPLSKALADLYVLNANRKHGTLTTFIRPAGDFSEADTKTTQKLIKVAKSGRANVQMGDGKNIFDFEYVGNLVHAHLLAAKALLKASETPDVKMRREERVGGEAFHITNDEPWLFWDFTGAIAEAAGHPVNDNEIKTIPRAMLIAFFAQWLVWIFSLGKKESALMTYGVGTAR